jgi:RecB family endonuclease NucS
MAVILRYSQNLWLLPRRAPRSFRVRDTLMYSTKDAMLERDMENLIAAFPEDFFPGHKFVLTGRQQSFCGVGRFDLLFTDSYQTRVLMELKAVTAKYENATQLAKYRKPWKPGASAIS